MSDLINRSEINDIIEGLEVYTSGKLNTMKVEISVLQLQRFINKLKDIPTAYDIDKVVEELEEIINPKEMYFCRVSKGRCIHNEDDIECIDCVAQRAIKIVKQGGVSEDVCKWNIDGDRAINPHTFSGYKIKQCDGLYALDTCPHCRKKIKVVE